MAKLNRLFNDVKLCVANHKKLSQYMMKVISSVRILYYKIERELVAKNVLLRSVAGNGTRYVSAGLMQCCASWERTVNSIFIPGMLTGR